MAIEPLQLEPDLPENENEESAKPALCITAPSKGAKSRFVILCAVVTAALGVRHVLGRSSGSTRNVSNRQSTAVEQPMDIEQPMDKAFVENFLCVLAVGIPKAGVLGQLKTTPSVDHALDAVPSCFDNADHLRSWYSSWYWIRRDHDGPFTANFNEVFKPANNTSAFDIHVSAYEADCGDDLACVSTPGIENGRHGSATWTAVKGKTYLLRVQHMPGTKFDVPDVTGSS
jgi:hypothetical protein